MGLFIVLASSSVVLFFLPLISALQLAIPQNPASGGSVNISWTPADGDPTTFSLELVNEVFHNSFAIGNNIPTNTGQLTVTLPIVPAGYDSSLGCSNVWANVACSDGYTLEAVQIR